MYYQQTSKRPAICTHTKYAAAFFAAIILLVMAMALAVTGTYANEVYECGYSEDEPGLAGLSTYDGEKKCPEI